MTHKLWRVNSAIPRAPSSSTRVGDQTCALGAALFAAVSAGEPAGGFADVANGQKAMCGVRERVYTPIPENQAVYQELYQIYLELHDAFGLEKSSGNMASTMKRLIDIRERQRS
jgi:L-ribulokinase